MNPSTFDSLAIEIDTDNIPNNGCDGFDLLIAGVIDGDQLKGVLVATPTCDPADWTSVSSATFGGGGTALSLTFPEAGLAFAPRLIWNAGVVPKAQTDPIDALPDHGVLVADNFLQQSKADDGYRLVDARGGVHAYGNAKFYGDIAGRPLARPIVGMIATPRNKGYWLVASDGGIFSFGDARFYGSTGAIRLASPIVGMTKSATGHGYRFVAADGGIFSFGDAMFLGGLGGGTPPSAVVGMD
jgi:hypothetical protein